MDWVSPIVQMWTGGISTALTNQANERISQRTNVQNYKMFQEQNEFNERMYNYNNYWNSPLQQRKRLEEAGYNPAALIDTPNIGSAQQISSGQPNPAVGYHFQSPLADMPSTLLQMAEAKKALAESKSSEIDAKYKESQYIATIDKLYADGWLSRANAEKAKQDVDFTEANWNALSRSIEQEAYYKREMARREKIENDLQEIYGDRIKSENLRKVAAEIDYLTQQGEESKAKQVLMGIQGDVEKYNAISGRINAYANQRLSFSQAELNQIEAVIKNKFGLGQAASDFMNSLKEGKIKDLDAFISQLTQSYYKGKGKHLFENTKALGELLGNLLPILGRIAFRF